MSLQTENTPHVESYTCDFNVYQQIAQMTDEFQSQDLIQIRAMDEAEYITQSTEGNNAK